MDRIPRFPRAGRTISVAGQHCELAFFGLCQRVLCCCSTRCSVKWRKICISQDGWLARIISFSDDARLAGSFPFGENGGRKTRIRLLQGARRIRENALSYLKYVAFTLSYCSKKNFNCLCKAMFANFSWYTKTTYQNSTEYFSLLLKNLLQSLSDVILR